MLFCRRELLLAGRQKLAICFELAFAFAMFVLVLLSPWINSMIKDAVSTVVNVRVNDADNNKLMGCIRDGLRGQPSIRLLGELPSGGRQSNEPSADVVIEPGLSAGQVTCVIQDSSKGNAVEKSLCVALIQARRRYLQAELVGKHLPSTTYKVFSVQFRSKPGGNSVLLELTLTLLAISLWRFMQTTTAFSERAFARERQEKMLETILSVPLRRGAILLGKGLAMFPIGIVGGVFWLLGVAAGIFALLVSVILLSPQNRTFSKMDFIKGAAAMNVDPAVLFLLPMIIVLASAFCSCLFFWLYAGGRKCRRLHSIVISLVKLGLPLSPCLILLPEWQLDGVTAWLPPVNLWFVLKTYFSGQSCPSLVIASMAEMMLLILTFVWLGMREYTDESTFLDP